MRLTQKQRDADRETEKAARHFIRWAKRKLHKKTTFDLYYETDYQKPYWYLTVEIPTNDCNEISHVTNYVLQLAKKYGLLKRFIFSGTGYGFGVRDISFVQKYR